MTEEPMELTDEPDNDILQDMDEGQLSEYRDMLKQLGSHPDKVLINTLSMIAEDYSITFPISSNKIYNAIKELLLSNSIMLECKLPLVYVMDSILKNAKGLYVEIMRKDHQWMKEVYIMLSANEENKSHPHTLARDRLRRVWNTWNQPPFKIFPEIEWKAMGKCFLDEDERIRAEKLEADAKTKKAGMERKPDGSLKLSIVLRKQMEAVLDELQADQVDELEKVSLERLADINPDLLVEIKNAAVAALENEPPSGSGRSGDPILLDGRLDSDGKNGGGVPSLFVEMRPDNVVRRCADWEKLNIDHMEVTNDSIRKLFRHVREGTSSMTMPSSSTPEEEADMVKLLGSASATASTLTNLLERLKQQNSNKGTLSFSAGSISNDLPGSSSSFYGNTMLSSSKSIDRSKFTTEGLKEKNDSVISRLYEGGLPFVSSSDGKRFATQIELSKHLDEVFRKAQLEKTMERNEERGWYHSARVWSGEVSKSSLEPNYDPLASENEFNGTVSSGPLGTTADPLSAMVTADESRDKCVICGINFTMHFDQDEGEWKYSNCREIEVLNDDVAEEESENMLVHVNCHRGLGSPAILTQDQILQLQ